MDGARVLLCVTGSIAAYKACELVRMFKKAGCGVRVAMTRSACEFVTPLTFATLSRNPVGVEMFDAARDWRPDHIALADADVAVVAPCTANVLAKLACGIADDLVTSTLLATSAPIVAAPAMNCGMWDNAATAANVAALRGRGVAIVPPADGELACGTSGRGRLAALEDIFAAAMEAVRGGAGKGRA